MAEHYTQGRQGMGSRRRRSGHHQGHRRQRMPRPEETPTGKPSLLKRILSFFGIGRKKDELGGEPIRNNNNTPKKSRQPRQRTGQGGNPAASARAGRRRAASTLPTRNARLYVGNLSYEATEAELEDLFKGFGNVRSVEIIYNPRTYKSKGYAFVEMYQLDDARRAAEVLHGQPFMGRELMVSAASEKTEHPRREDADESTRTEGSSSEHECGERDTSADTAKAEEAPRTAGTEEQNS